MIRIRQVKIPITQDTPEEIQKKLGLLLKINPTEILETTIHKKSIDARKKSDIYYVYEIDLKVENEKKILKKNHSNDIFKAPIEIYQFPQKQCYFKYQPIIVGSGPAGLFTAYVLAENGYHPLIIERGEKLEDRIKSVENFWQTGDLKPQSNVQFGEGGAGTFSDGKLNTLVKDKNFRGLKVFQTFVKNGAPKEIMYLQKPHIGTNLLREVVKNMRNEIINMGGKFLYNTTLTDIMIENQQLQAIEINHTKQIPCTHLILAIGHSARDTFEMLYKTNLKMEAKPFAIGLRIQHQQNMINTSQYGSSSQALPAASYKLTYTSTSGRGVYSFCMCPGGYVVNASSEAGLLAINGMSNHERESENANSALVVTITPNDFGSEPLSGLTYQRQLEKKAYELGHGKIPVQLWKDFEKKQISTDFGSIKPIFKGDTQFADLNNLLPKEICEALKEAIPSWNHKISGFSHPDAILAGIESRTSSPIRIIRNEDCMSNIIGIYPCGEGSGYAGGITTAAMDGIKVAESIVLQKINQ